MLGSITKASALAVALLAAVSVAHPGENPVDDYAQRGAYLKTLEKKDASHCMEELKASGHYDRMVKRRAEVVAQLRKERGLENTPMLTERDAKDVLGKSHKSSQPYTANTPHDTIFASNKSCILSPEITEGPYYVSGEFIRSDVTEGQAGVPLTFDILLLDQTTCKPIPQAHLEIWSCNATGVYAGIASAGNGNANDLSNLNNTALRGIQLSDNDGVVSFKTLIPGHYSGRANHIHVLSHIGAKVLPNNTISGGTLSHIGQTYFDQSLLDAVEKTAPYSTNTIAKTANSGDMWLTQGAANGDDPIINYSLIGSSLQDGVFGWITLGMDPKAGRTINPAVWYGQGGGVKNPNAMGNGFGGFPGFGGGFPGFGAPPAGGATAGGAGGFGGFGGGFGGGFPGWPPAATQTAKPEAE